jgi:hypothetical protein
MNALFYWVKRIIVGIAKFFIAICSGIINALEPDTGPKGHPLKHLSISINSEGQITLKGVNGIPFNEFYEKSPFHTQVGSNQSTDSNGENKPMVAMNLIQIGGQCYEVRSDNAGGLTCFPKACQ